jgi:centromere protein I
LEEIESVNEFVDKLEKIELPNQLVASLRDPLLHKFLQLKPSVSISQRIDQWLLAFFEDQLETPGSEKTILEMLEAIRDYTNHTKVCSPYGFPSVF